MDFIKKFFQNVKKFYIKCHNFSQSLKLQGSQFLYFFIGLIQCALLWFFWINFYDAFFYTDPFGIAKLALITLILSTVYILYRSTKKFYQEKLLYPIHLLEKAAEKIENNDLNFELHYDCQDEMGDLVASFEKMRQTVVKNNQQLWRGLEERKRLNAAFTHDLRTPLTVLRGYVDFLREFIPNGQIDENKILETLYTMSAHIKRLETYTKEMNALQKLQDIHVEKQSVSFINLMEDMKNQGDILAEETVKDFRLESNPYENTIFLDQGLFFQLYNNLLNNAFRYAKNFIHVICSVENGYINLIIEDDGVGFTMKDLHQATNAFYRNEFNSSESNEHFGLGLYICKVIASNHGGKLALDNNINGGAKVCVSLNINP